MKNNVNYLIIKDKKSKKTIHLDGQKLEGYSLIKNRNKLINGVSVKNIVILKASFIEKVIDKKIDKKLKSLLELIASICENNDDSSSSMRYALSEIEKFRRITINQFALYMNKKQLEKLEKKVKIIEQELTTRLYQYSQIYEQKELENEKNNHRRR